MIVIDSISVKYADMLQCLTNDDQNHNVVRFNSLEDLQYGCAPDVRIPEDVRSW